MTDDFVLRGASGGSASRHLNLAFSPISGGPSGTSEGLFTNIRGILSIPSGESRITGAVIDSSAGTFRFNTTYVDPTVYATRVLVSRTGNTWTVTADPGIPSGGDVAALTVAKGNTTNTLGFYHMPFQITIVCPTCPQ